MKFSKVMTGLMSVMALTAIAAGATNAATPGQFDFTTVFTPGPISSSGGDGNYITITNNSAIEQFTPSQVTLATFMEHSTTPRTGSNIVDSNFDVAVTVTPDGGTSMTEHILGNIKGSFNNNISNLTETTYTPTLSYDFGALGVYTFDTVSFTAPGIRSSTVPGSLGASVNYAPAAVPEPATIAPFALGGIGLMGLALRARKAKATGTRAA